MNGIDEYSNYLGPEPTDEQIEKRADEIYCSLSEDGLLEMASDIGLETSICEYLDNQHATDFLEHIEDKLRRGEL